MLWYAMVCYGMLRYAVVCSGTQWYAVVSYGMVSHGMECHAKFGLTCLGQVTLARVWPLEPFSSPVQLFRGFAAGNSAAHGQGRRRGDREGSRRRRRSADGPGFQVPVAGDGDTLVLEPVQDTPASSQASGHNQFLVAKVDKNQVTNQAKVEVIIGLEA